ncbi:MAG: SPASM domain-containing protein, partial [Bacteroidota bacterium]
LNAKEFQITLDGNEEYHDQVRFVSKTRGSYREIINNIILLAENQLHVTLRINYTQHNLHSIHDILDDLEHLGSDVKPYINISLHKVWQDTGENLSTTIYTFMDRVKAEGFATTHGILGDSVRYSCYADKKNQATINYNGEVFKCTARDFVSENKEGVLNEKGEIEWNEKYENRFASRLKNPPCLECSILPICGGGCSQKAMESIGEDYCVHDFNEAQKKEVVKQRFIAIAEDLLVAEA